MRKLARDMIQLIAQLLFRITYKMDDISKPPDRAAPANAEPTKDELRTAIEQMKSVKMQALNNEAMSMAMTFSGVFGELKRANKFVH